MKIKKSKTTQEKLKLFLKVAKIATFIFLLSPQSVYAQSGVENLRRVVVDLVQPWIEGIGGAIVVVGAIQVGLSFITDNPDAKTRGVTFISGGLVTRYGVRLLINLVF